MLVASTPHAFLRGVKNRKKDRRMSAVKEEERADSEEAVGLIMKVMMHS